MKKLLVATVASLMTLGSVPSWAWSHVSGSITSIDPKAHQIVLDNGQTYSVQSRVKLAKLAVGDKVTVSTEAKNGKNLVNKVTKTT